MRLIDADELKLKESLEEAILWRKEAEAKGDTEIAIRADGVCSVFVELLLRIKALPTIEVVYCKQCKYWNDAWSVCKRFSMSRGTLDFCSTGERRTE